MAIKDVVWIVFWPREKAFGVERQSGDALCEEERAGV